jgi:hypothetical protein
MRDSFPSVQEKKSKDFGRSLKHAPQAFGLTTQCFPHIADISERADSGTSIDRAKIETRDKKRDRAKIISTNKGKVHIITPRSMALKKRNIDFEALKNNP